MNQDDTNIQFKKPQKDVLTSGSSKIKIPKGKVILKIMDKYGVSSSEAERILLKIEKKEQIKRNSGSDILIFENRIKSTQNRENHNSPKKSTLNKSKFDLDRTSDNKRIIDSIKQDINQEPLKNQINPPKLQNNDKISKKNISSDRVDFILGDIIPDYNKQISINVNHVDLTFEVQVEKIDTLKEAVIRFLRRDKSKKIKIHALKDVSFQIYKGEKVGIIGYNGAGKSTLLNVIAGIYPPDKGFVKTYGNISPLLSLGAGFDHNFSGRKNIMINGAMLGYDKEYLKSKIDDIIEFSELGEFIDIPIKNYSSGMLAKLGFSIATIVNPDILIVDEILGVGDVNFQKKSSDKMKSLMDGGTTVLFVSHSIPQVRQICDKAIWIDNGHVRCMGEVNKVCDEYLKDAEKASNEQLANIQLVN